MSVRATTPADNTRSARRGIDLWIDADRPSVRVRVPAQAWAVVVVRQAVMALGRRVGGSTELLGDAALAVTEAVCAAIRGSGRPRRRLEVEMRPDGSDLLVLVRYRAARKLVNGRALFRDTDREVAGAIVEGIAAELEVRGGGREPTEIVMRFPAGQGVQVADGLCSRLTRQVAAVAGAQADLPRDHLVEAMLVSEEAARQASGRFGPAMRVAVDRVGDGVQLGIGPLGPEGSKRFVVRATGAGTGFAFS